MFQQHCWKECLAIYCQSRLRSVYFGIFQYDMQKKFSFEK